MKPACQKHYEDLVEQHTLPLGSHGHQAAAEDDNLDEGLQLGRESSATPDDVPGSDGGLSSAEPTKRRRVMVEEVEDEDMPGAHPWIAEDYPGRAAETLGRGITHFDDLCSEQEALGQAAHAPFADDDKWGLAKWLISETTQTGLDKFLKLPITRNKTCPTFKNKDAFFKKVDKLPTGSAWICDVISIEGDQRGPNGEPLREEVELWRRDVVDCVRELIGNPAFKERMAYAPTRLTRDGVRYYGEMHTADWWWDI
ncbi:hypothetical protein BN946_scf184877.g2 [Trametes cinnabarina]|uniref:Uncharacterized protein n=1 Tax=Pycnoporus cinnabarinus TaxID=5643 RepID=A0A060STY0_PYCCI|nr:hypothetical protein BN946_scf184877.g2 [Trametes cinnabarina]